MIFDHGHVSLHIECVSFLSLLLYFIDRSNLLLFHRLVKNLYVCNNLTVLTNWKESCVFYFIWISKCVSEFTKMKEGKEQKKIVTKLYVDEFDSVATDSLFVAFLSKLPTRPLFLLVLCQFLKKMWVGFDKKHYANSCFYCRYSLRWWCWLSVWSFEFDTQKMEFIFVRSFSLSV